MGLLLHCAPVKTASILVIFPSPGGRISIVAFTQEARSSLF